METAKPPWMLMARWLKEPSPSVKSLRKAISPHTTEHKHYSMHNGLLDLPEGKIKFYPPPLNVLREHSASATELNNYVLSLAYQGTLRGTFP